MQRNASPLNIDTEDLTAIVCKAMRRSDLVLANWSIRPIHGGLGEGEGVYQLAGQAQYSGGVVAWSLILKVLAQPTHGGSPTDWNYWRREADAYHSGALADLPGSLRAPHCYAVNEQLNGQIWVWMEYAREPSSLTWSLADYRQIAYQLGQFSGAYLDGRPLPSGSWVSSQWLRGRVYSNEPFIPVLRQNSGHPWVRRSFPPDVLTGMQHIWDERDLFLDALARLPQTFCHWDCHRSNILVVPDLAGNTETVVIDWAFAGQGALGAEISPLVITSYGFFHVDPADAMELEKQVLAGYLEGLRSAGWDGDPRQIRLGYAATSAIWHGVGGLHLELPILLNEQLHPVIERAFGRTLDVILERWTDISRNFILRLADEAHTLIEQT